jgi:hypothetical protein
MERLTEHQRWIGIGMLQTESQQVDVARNLNVSVSCQQIVEQVSTFPQSG